MYYLTYGIISKVKFFNTILYLVSFKFFFYHPGCQSSRDHRAGRKVKHIPVGAGGGGGGLLILSANANHKSCDSTTMNHVTEPPTPDKDLELMDTQEGKIFYSKFLLNFQI